MFSRKPTTIGHVDPRRSAGQQLPKNFTHSNSRPVLNQARPEAPSVTQGMPPIVQSFNRGTDQMRILALGGFGNVTQNMYAYEYVPGGDLNKSQIIIVDCGVGFPETDIFGVDLIIPDLEYLLDKKDRVLGIFITHGHEDHIGAMRFVLPQLGPHVPVYAPKLAKAFMEARLAESQIRSNITEYKPHQLMKAGPFTVDPILVNHSIPDTHHFAITTPLGVFYHGSDFKFDCLPLDGKYTDMQHICQVGSKGVVCLMSDALGSEHLGFSPSERSIAENFEQQIKSAKGRVFVTTISSNIVRWGQAIAYGKRANRKIVMVGFSVERAINLSKELGYLDVKDQDILTLERVKNFTDDKLLFLVAGFAGQPESALSKMVMGKHKIKIKSGDKVIFSSPDYIPGTTSGIFNMIDTLSKMGAEVVYGEKEDIHVSGHAFQNEHAILINMLKPKFLLPIGGNFRHIKAYHEMAKLMGYNDSQLLSPDVNQAATFYSNGTADTKSTIPHRKILIDGFGIGDVGTTVLRDRKLLAEDGMFAVIMLVDSVKGTLEKDPIILSRGFVFVKENTDLLDYLKLEIKNKFKEVSGTPNNFEYVKEQVQGHLEQVIYDKTGRQPMILPLVVELE